jgi:hypothetical protein
MDSVHHFAAHVHGAGPRLVMTDHGSVFQSRSRYRESQHMFAERVLSEWRCLVMHVP